MKQPQATKAPETGTGSAEVDNQRKQVAKHFLLDSAGEVVEEETQATGIRYVHIASGQTFDYQLKPGSDAMRMFALMGAKTLATNEASAVRQKEGDTGDQVGAIKERFALIDTGVWVDRTREGGVRIDKDILAEAAIQVMIAKGALKDEPEVVGNAKAKLRQKLEDDPKAVAVVRGVDGVAAKYAQLSGKATRSVDDLAALVA